MKATAHFTRPGAAGRRIFGRAQRSATIDPYGSPLKPGEPIVCPQCLAVYHSGRWSWGSTPSGATERLCPACRRINDRLPAGIVTLHGTFSRDRMSEMTALARRQEESERADHPLNRIMDVSARPDALVITTTDIHLPRRIGEAMKRAFHGELAIHCADMSYFVRVDWHQHR